MNVFRFLGLELYFQNNKKRFPSSYIKPKFKKSKAVLVCTSPDDSGSNDGGFSFPPQNFRVKIAKGGYLILAYQSRYNALTLNFKCQI